MKIATRPLVALRIASVVLPLLAAIIWAAAVYVDEHKDATRRAESNAVILGKYLERIIETQGLLHRVTRHYVEPHDADYINSDALRRFLATITVAQPSLINIAIITLDGQLVTSSDYTPDLSPGFNDPNLLAELTDRDATVLNRIVDPLNGQDVFVIASSFQFNGFDGAIVSSMATSAITDFLHSVALEPEHAASIIRQDGLLLVRNYPTPPVMLPEEAAGRIAIASGQPKGSFRAVAVTDNINRLYAYGKVQDHPIYVNYGIPVFQVNRAVIIQVLPVLLVLAAISAWLISVANSAQRTMTAKLENDAAQLRVEEAEKLSAQRSDLVEEMNHRIKNNLTVIGSIISMQMRTGEPIDPAELHARIMAVSEVHDLMYKSQNLESLDVAALLKGILSNGVFVPPERGIIIDFKAEEGIFIGSDVATPLAIITAELVTNAVKHAYPNDRTGTISVGLEKVDRTARLTISDDGIGMPSTPSRKSGTRIVDAFVDQIGGNLAICPKAGGTTYKIDFEVREKNILLRQDDRPDVDPLDHESARMEQTT